MTSFLRYKQQLRTVQDADDIESWITVRGNHIPIKKGQSKEEAVKAFVESKGGNSSTTSSNTGGKFEVVGGSGIKHKTFGTQAEAEKWAKENVNKIHSSLKVVSGYKKYKEYEPKKYDPEFEVVRKNALANSSLYGGKYTQKSKAEAYKEYKNDTSSKENMKKANEFVNGSGSQQSEKPKDIMEWSFNDVMQLPVSDPRVHKYIAKNNGLKTSTVSTLAEAFGSTEDLYFEIDRISDRKGYGWDKIKWGNK